MNDRLGCRPSREHSLPSPTTEIEGGLLQIQVMMIAVRRGASNPECRTGKYRHVLQHDVEIRGMKYLPYIWNLSIHLSLSCCCFKLHSARLIII
jgi:hypothetical protein